MKISVRTAAGWDVSLECKSDESVESVKMMIEDKTGILRECVLVLFGDKTLENGHTLQDYKIDWLGASLARLSLSSSKELTRQNVSALSVFVFCVPF